MYIYVVRYYYKCRNLKRCLGPMTDTVNMGLEGCSTCVYTVCQRSSDRFCIVAYYLTIYYSSRLLGQTV